MVDTLKIYTQDYSFADNTKLIQRTDLNMETGLIYQKYYFNSDVFNLTINNKGLFLQFSVPKLYGAQDNVYSVGANGAKIAISRIEPILKDLGIYTSLSSFRISRIDLFKNVEASRPFFEYSFIFDFLNLKRTISSRYGTTYTYMNNRRELVFYDKNQELLQTYGYRIRDVEHLIRGEVRLKQHSVCVKEGFDYVKDLPNQWDIVKEVYYKHLKQFFSFDLKENKEMKEKRLLIELFKTYKKRAPLIAGHAKYRILKDNELKNLLLSEYPRRTAFRYLQEFRQSIQVYENFLNHNTGFKDLYLELKNKFLKEVKNEKLERL